MKDRDLLEAVGTARYGVRYRTPIANRLGVDRRTVQRWVDGQFSVPDWIWVELARAIDEHQSRLAWLHEKCCDLQKDVDAAD